MELSSLFPPTAWRCLLKAYGKSFLLAAVASLALLMTTRLDEVVHFAAMGAKIGPLLYFVSLQIPFILPIILPISCLISSSLLTQRLSASNELIALRAAGFSLFQIFQPLLLGTLFLGLLHFWITSEVSTSSQLKANHLRKELRTVNPLLLLGNKHVVKQRGMVFETLAHATQSESASAVLLGVPNKKQKRIDLILGENVDIATDLFTTSGLSLLYSKAPPTPDGFDHLMVENVAQAQSSTQDLHRFLQMKLGKINSDHLSLSLLISRIQQKRNELSNSSNAQTRKELTRAYSEIIRRISLALSVLTFTLLGFACHLQLSRRPYSSRFFWNLLLPVLFFFSYFSAKAQDHNLLSSSLFYLLPHLLLVAVSLFFLWRTNRGIA